MESDLSNPFAVPTSKKPGASDGESIPLGHNWVHTRQKALEIVENFELDQK